MTEHLKAHYLVLGSLSFLLQMTWCWPVNLLPLYYLYKMCREDGEGGAAFMSMVTGVIYSTAALLGCFDLIRFFPMLLSCLGAASTYFGYKAIEYELRQGPGSFWGIGYCGIFQLANCCCLFCGFPLAWLWIPMGLVWWMVDIALIWTCVPICCIPCPVTMVTTGVGCIICASCFPVNCCLSCFPLTVFPITGKKRKVHPRRRRQQQQRRRREGR